MTLADALPAPTIAVVGAGAIGTHLAGRLIASADVKVAVVARPSSLAAIAADGIELVSVGQRFGGRPACLAARLADVGDVDIAFVAVKSPALPSLADDLGRAAARGTRLAFLLNGLPWWWTVDEPGAGPMRLVDPGGTLQRAVDPRAVIGAVVYSANVRLAPGRAVHHPSGTPDRWIVGAVRPDGTKAAQGAADLLGRCGLPAEASRDIRRDVLEKLVFNIAGNPLSALTRLRPEALGSDGDLAKLAAALRGELRAIAVAGGRPLSTDDRLDHFGPPGAPSSMLQDVLAGRPTEVEAILGEPQQLARRLGVATPSLDIVLALMRGLDRSARDDGRP